MYIYIHIYIYMWRDELRTILFVAGSNYVLFRMMELSSISDEVKIRTISLDMVQFTYYLVASGPNYVLFRPNSNRADLRTIWF